MILRYARSGMRDFLHDGVIVNSRPFWELYMVSEGSISPIFPDLPKPSQRENTVWIMPKGLAYGWSGPGLAMRHMAQFTRIPDTLKHILVEHGHITRGLDSSELKQMIRYFSILEEHNTKSHFFSELQIEKCILDMCLLVFSKFDSPDFSIKGKGEELKIIRACDWFVDHMHEAPSMKEVAEVVHLSEGYFRRLFKKLRNLSPHAYFMELRMSRAKKLLQENELSIEKIADLCGFGSSTAFHRAFKQQIKLSPKAWKSSPNE